MAMLTTRLGLIGLIFSPRNLPQRFELGEEAANAEPRDEYLQFLSAFNSEHTNDHH